MTTIPQDVTTDASIDVSGEAEGTIDFEGDRDWYRVSLQADHSYSIDLTGTSLSDPYLRLFDGAGRLINENDDHSGLDSHIEFQPRNTGDYFLSAGAYSDGSAGSYLISIIDSEDLDTGSHVTTLTDALRTDGELSLREAMLNANANADSDHTRITFDESLSGGTILLSRDLPEVTHPLTVDGGADSVGASAITIDGGFQSESNYSATGSVPFRVTNTSLTLEDLTIANSYGSAIMADNSTVNISRAELTGTQSIYYGPDINVVQADRGRVIITDSSINGNSGSFVNAVEINDAGLRIRNSDISNNNGNWIDLIQGTGPVTIDNSTIGGNSGYYFSAINVVGTVELSGSSIYSNGNEDSFSAIADVTGTLTIQNSTIAENFGYSIKIDAGAQAVVTNSTISGSRPTTHHDANGYGVVVDPNGTLRLENSIINDEINGAVRSRGQNVFLERLVRGSGDDDRLDVAPAELFADSVTLSDSIITGELALNGGPTPTIALLDSPDNPALDAANPANAPETDQRGEDRKRGPDIGAFELQNNLPPVAEDATLDTVSDIAVPGQLVGSDPDGDSLTFALTRAPRDGSVAIDTDGDFEYRPDSGFIGDDSFTFTANDGEFDSAPARVRITVAEPPNQRPAADAQNISTGENVAVAGRLSGSDPDGDTLSFFAVDEPRHGAVVVEADGDFIYTPDPDFFGTDSFTFKADDGAGTSSKARVTVTVSETPNQPPVATDQSVSVPEDAVLAGTLVAIDPDGDPLAFAKAMDPAHGSLRLETDGTFTYTPERDFDGTDSFTFTASDGEAESAAAMVTITIVPDGIDEIVVPEIGGEVFGTAGNDILVGLAGAETLHGLAGNDVIDGAGGADRMNGGPGNDRYTVDNAGDQVIEMPLEGFDRINLMIDLDNFRVPDNVEQLILFDGVITATPASTGSKLAGLGDDNLFFSGPGTDFYDGNAGRDTLTYENATAGVEASFLKPTAFNTGGAGTDKIDDMEILIGSDFDDVLVGGQGVSNEIFGGGGDDVIVGFAGPDQLSGGEGADTFMYNRLNFRDSLIGDGEDTILDFESGEDVIDLSRLRVEMEKLSISPGRLEADVTGNGNPDFAINLDNNVLLTPGDILL